MSFRTFAAASSAIQALSTEATSGPWPARTAAISLVSMLSADTELRTIFTWRFSCWYWLIAFSSGGLLIVVNGLITQKLSVVDPDEGLLEQLAVTRPPAMAAPVIAVCLRKFRRDMGANTRSDDSASESRQYSVDSSVISLSFTRHPKDRHHQCRRSMRGGIRKPVGTHSFEGWPVSTEQALRRLRAV